MDAAFERHQHGGTDSQRPDVLPDCLKRLSQEASCVLSARFADDLSYDAIGQRLDMSTEAVWKTLFRTKKQLRDCVNTRLRGAS